MPGIGSLIHEIDVNIVRNLIKANKLLLSKTSSRVLSVNDMRGTHYVSNVSWSVMCNMLSDGKRFLYCKT